MWVPYVIVKSHFHMSPNQTYDRDDPSPLDQTQDAVILSLKTRSEPSHPTVSPNQMLPKISRRVLLEKRPDHSKGSVPFQSNGLVYNHSKIRHYHFNGLKLFLTSANTCCYLLPSTSASVKDFLHFVHYCAVEIWNGLILLCCWDLFPCWQSRTRFKTQKLPKANSCCQRNFSRTISLTRHNESAYTSAGKMLVI